MPHFPVSHFSTLQFCAAFSIPAFSSPAFFFVPHFHVSHFQTRSCIAFSFNSIPANTCRHTRPHCPALPSASTQYLQTCVDTPVHTVLHCLQHQLNTCKVQTRENTFLSPSGPTYYLTFSYLHILCKKPYSYSWLTDITGGRRLLA